MDPLNPLQSSRSEEEFSRLHNQESLGRVQSESPASKYSDVWQRAKLKIRVNLALSRLLDKSNPRNSSSQNASQVFTIKKSSRLFTSSPQNKQPVTPWFIFYPKSKFKIWWNFFLALVLLYTATVTPFTMAFVESEEWDYWRMIDLFIDFLFFVDFLMTCLTAYFDDFDNLVVNVWKIVFHYSKSWMVVDILSFFPFNLFDSENPESRGPNDFSKVFRIPRVYKLLKVTRLLKMLVHCKNIECVERFQMWFTWKNSVMRLVKSLITILICVHVSACFWYFSAKIEQFGPDTWVSRYQYQDSDTATKYLVSVYWAFTTLCTVGYGDISGFTNLERLLSIGWMVCGHYFFAFTIGTLSSMMSSIESNKDILENKLQIIDQFAEEANLSDKLKKRIQVALKYSANRRGFSWTDKLEIINELPKHLRYEVAINMHRGAAKDIKVFKDKDQSLIAFVVPLLLPMFLQKDEFVYSELEFADEIYFVVRGRVSYNCDNDSISFYAVQRGDYFGDIEVLKGIARKYSAHAVRETEVLILKRDLLSEIKEKFQDFWSEIKKKAIRKEQAFEKIVIEMQEIIRLKKTGQLASVNMHIFKQKIQEIFEMRCKSIKTEYEYELKDVENRLETLSELLSSKRLRRFAFSESEVEPYLRTLN
jgi:CRP-like cAMP-binding protein